jgi:hypothetical protein
MILTQTKPYSETSGTLDEKFFGVADQGMIFDILRSKLYSNPILAVCREISCNARDAHREVGKFDVPIHIHLPFGLEPVYKIRDEGLGISPDRMENVFINYTASTKRNDNVFCGGFGLGCKTPFSVSDQFTIETIHEGIKYNYVCFIDETKIGKLALLNKVPTDQPSGTEISIPVKHADFNFFRSYTEQSCRHWDVKPVITGGTIQWQTLDKVLEGEGWAIAATNDYNRVAKLIIDGIEYPLELTDLRKYADPKLIDASRGIFVMYFNVGELSLSANREQIFLDKPTQEKIRTRLDSITKVLKKQVDDKIQAYPSLWDANMYYQAELMKAFNGVGWLGQVSWHGHILHGRYLTVGCTVYTYTKGRYSRRHGNDPNKISRHAGHNISFEENAVLYINDLPLHEPTAKHVKKAFDDANVKKVFVICPSDKCTEDDLNTSISLKELNPKKLSSITKASARAYTPCLNRLLLFKFDGRFSRISYENMELDTNDKVLCLLERDVSNGERTALNGTTSIDHHSLDFIKERFKDVSLYGVDKDTDPTRLEKEFSDFIRLEDYMAKVLDNKKIDYVAVKYARAFSGHMSSYELEIMEKIAPFIEKKDSIAFQRSALHKKLHDMRDKDEGLLNLYETLKCNITDAALTQYAKDHPEMDADKMSKVFHKKYPLFDAFELYRIQRNDIVLKHVAHYVNAIDKL